MSASHERRIAQAERDAEELGTRRLGPLIVLVSMDLPVVVTLEAGLSFLGLGVPPPLASLGTLLNDGYATLGRSPDAVIAAASVLAIMTLGFTLLGEALRDAIDPRLRSIA